MKDYDKLKELVDKIESMCRKYAFDVDGVDSNGEYIELSCRENGDVGEEEWSQEDYDNGEKLIKELEENFDVECNMDLCDEWVLINVKIK